MEDGALNSPKPKVTDLDGHQIATRISVSRGQPSIRQQVFHVRLLGHWYPYPCIYKYTYSVSTSPCARKLWIPALFVD